MNTCYGLSMNTMPNQPKTKIRGIRIPDELWEAVQRISAERGETPSEVVRVALTRYVKRHG